MCVLLACIAAPRTPAESLLSTRRHYLVDGFGPRQNLDIARWAERLEDRLAERFGAPPPFRKAGPIRILASEPGGEGPPRVLARQDPSRPLKAQSLEIRHPARVSEEDLLEGLCTLLLQRYAAKRVPGQKGRTPPLPAWFVAGTAQDLVPELRARNRQMVLALWERRQAPSPADILEWVHLPSGFSEEKAAAGLLAGWLYEAGRADPGVRRRLWGALVRTPRLLPEDLQAILGVESASALARRWDLWIASRANVQSGIPRSSPADWDRLLQIARHPVLADAASAAAGARRRSVDDRRRALYTGQLKLELRRLSAGAGPELAARCSEWVHFIRAVETGAAKGEAAREQYLALRRKLEAAIADRKQRASTLDRLEADPPAPAKPGGGPES